MIGEAKDGFVPGQPVPAVTAHEAPESVGGTGVGVVWRNHAQHVDLDAVEGGLDGCRVRIVPGWGEGAAVPVVGGDEVEDEVGIAGLVEELRVGVTVISWTLDGDLPNFYGPSPAFSPTCILNLDLGGVLGGIKPTKRVTGITLAPSVTSEYQQVGNILSRITAAPNTNTGNTNRSTPTPPTNNVSPAS